MITILLFLWLYNALVLVMSNSPPKFLKVDPVLFVEEDTAPDTVLTEITAIDDDGDRLFFSLIASPDIAKMLSLKPTSTTSASLVLVSKINKIIGIKNTIHYQVTDSNLYSQRSCLLIITPVNPPTLDNLPNDINLTEDNTIGTIVYNVTEKNVTGHVTFSLENTTNDMFSINADTGEIKLNKHLDYTLQRFYNLSIIAKNAKSLTVTSYLLINVLYSRNKPPYFVNSPYNANIQENTPIGTVVLKITAYDGNTNLPEGIIYIIQSGDLGLFRIDNTTGVLSVYANIDREDIRIINYNYTLNILVQACSMWVKAWGQNCSVNIISIYISADQNETTRISTIISTPVSTPPVPTTPSSPLSSPSTFPTTPSSQKSSTSPNMTAGASSTTRNPPHLVWTSLPAELVVGGSVSPPFALGRVQARLFGDDGLLVDAKITYAIVTDLNDRFVQIDQDEGTLSLVSSFTTSSLSKLTLTIEAKAQIPARYVVLQGQINLFIDRSNSCRPAFNQSELSFQIRQNVQASFGSVAPYFNNCPNAFFYIDRTTGNASKYFDVAPATGDLDLIDFSFSGSYWFRVVASARPSLFEGSIKVFVRVVKMCAEAAWSRTWIRAGLLPENFLPAQTVIDLMSYIQPPNSNVSLTVSQLKCYSRLDSPTITSTTDYSHFFYIDTFATKILANVSPSDGVVVRCDTDASFSGGVRCSSIQSVAISVFVLSKLDIISFSINNYSDVNTLLKILSNSTGYSFLLNSIQTIDYKSVISSYAIDDNKRNIVPANDILSLITSNEQLMKELSIYNFLIKPPQKSSDPSSSLTIIILASVLACVAFISLLLCIFCLVMRNRYKKASSSSTAISNNMYNLNQSHTPDTIHEFSEMSIETRTNSSNDEAIHLKSEKSSSGNSSVNSNSPPISSNNSSVNSKVATTNRNSRDPTNNPTTYGRKGASDHNVAYVNRGFSNENLTECLGSDPGIGRFANKGHGAQQVTFDLNQPIYSTIDELTKRSSQNLNPVASPRSDDAPHGQTVTRNIVLANPPYDNHVLTIHSTNI